MDGFPADDEILEIPQPGSEAWKRTLPRPDWLRLHLTTNKAYGQVSAILKRGGLHTVCREARCPNQQECWSAGTATFIIMGDTCTRCCAYCNVRSGHPAPLNPDEPLEVAKAVQSMGLHFAVITSVDRDDQPDGGAEHFAQVIERVHEVCPRTGVEVLIPDFSGNLASLERVLAAAPQVLNHNVETVPRLYPRLRSRGIYERCLELLSRVDERRRQGVIDPKMRLKSGMMVGLGESFNEILAVLRDLRACGVDVVTLGQYLRPTLQNVPVMRYWHPQEFLRLKNEALAMGFSCVEAAPLVRSSYHAARCAAPD